jgi:hypothetical protein
MLRMRARSLTIDQVVVEDVYSQTRSTCGWRRFCASRKPRGAGSLSASNQDALQALLGDDVTAGLGKRV